MGSLNAFLHPIKTENEEVIVSKRFVDDGKVQPFVIKPVTQAVNKELIKKYTEKDKKGNQSLNNAKYTTALVAAAVVEPDLTNAQLQKQYGVLGAEALLDNMLYAGEFVTLSEAVQKLSGIDVDEEELIEDVKNE